MSLLRCRAFMAKSMIQIRDDERMWIAMSDSFVSTVQDRNDPNTLVVRDGRRNT